MQWEQLSFLDPKYLYRSHPFDLRSNCESDPLSERLDSALPINRIQPIINTAQPDDRQQVLERLVEKISQPDLPGKKYFEHYLRHKYRRNCKSNTLRQAATSLIQFLSFFAPQVKSSLSR